MIFGHVRYSSPHVSLTLLRTDEPLTVEFVVDTGFEGELALPSALANRLVMTQLKYRLVEMADRTERKSIVGTVSLEWDGETRPTEALVLEGNPLLGMLLLEGSHVHIEAVDGGEVLIESF
jgi:clan AA aspartic protease